MNRDFIAVFLISSALLVGITKYNDFVRGQFVDMLSSVKSTYWNIYENVDNTISEHFHQKEQIKKLSFDLQQYKSDRLLLQSIAAELNHIMAEYDTLLVNKKDIELARALSYVQFGDLNKVWLDMKNYDNTKVHGMLTGGYAAGIVVERYGRAMGLLNGDIKCSYAVNVGSTKAPGIVRGKGNSQTMVAEFIPTWMQIKKGDEVTTSGLDNLFFEGIKVGVVVSVEKMQGYQNAIISPYADTLHAHFFSVIKNK